MVSMEAADVIAALEDEEDSGEKTPDSEETPLDAVSYEDVEFNADFNAITASSTAASSTCISIASVSPEAGQRQNVQPFVRFASISIFHNCTCKDLHLGWVKSAYHKCSLRQFFAGRSRRLIVLRVSLYLALLWLRMSPVFLYTGRRGDQTIETSFEQAVLICK